MNSTMLPVWIMLRQRACPFPIPPCPLKERGPPTSITYGCGSVLVCSHTRTHPLTHMPLV